MDVPSHSRMVPAQNLGPAGWATVRATEWRAGRGAGALAALCMLAAGTGAAGWCWYRYCAWYFRCLLILR